MKTFRASWLRFSVAAAFLIVASVFLTLRSRAEIVPAHKILADFPRELDGRIAKEQQLSAEALAVLGPGDFMVRDYIDPAGVRYPVNLYIAYFQSQRTGDTIHSPKNCLPGAGWVPVQVDHVSLTGSDGGPITVNRYVLGNGEQRLLALYWYQAHGRVVASEYSAKLYLVADAMRLNRTDGALVRILTPVERGENIDAAQVRTTEFASTVIPSLDQYIPR
ncbi:MAG TPA: EpsI family protein [Candidatus Acidoferrales bacterium]|nr:EpsI family protein [Candidatus Acidoferrales bacterium]